MHSLGSEIAPNRASDLGWLYYACRIFQSFLKALYKQQSMLNTEKNLRADSTLQKLTIENQFLKCQI